MNKYIVGIGIIIILILGSCLYISVKSNAKLKTDNKMYNEILTDSLVKTKDKLGNIVNSTNVIEANNTRLLLKLSSKDTMINKLQTFIKAEEANHRTVKTALVVSEQINISLKDTLATIISKVNAIRKGDSVFLYPTYTKDLIEKDNWFNGKIAISNKECAFKLVTKNEYTVAIGTEKIGLFKSKSYAEVTNLNPYVDIKAMKVYEQTPKINTTFKTSCIVGGVGIIVGLLLHLL